MINDIKKILNTKELLPYVFTSPVKTLTLITGSDSSHYKSLNQFLNTIPKSKVISRVIIYDLGLTETEHKNLVINFPNYDIRIFDYSKYPEHVNIKTNAGEYAWKPIIISDVLNEVKSPILWLDAGCIVKNDFKWVRKIINKIGFYSPNSSGSLVDWTHPILLKILEMPKHMYKYHNLSGASIAVNYSSSETVKLIHEWKEKALIKDYIAPEGSSRKNHRQDQALLSTLGYKRNVVKHNFIRPYGFRTHKDID